MRWCPSENKTQTSKKRCVHMVLEWLEKCLSDLKNTHELQKNFLPLNKDQWICSAPSIGRQQNYKENKTLLRIINRLNSLGHVTLCRSLPTPVIDRTIKETSFHFSPAVFFLEYFWAFYSDLKGALLVHVPEKLEGVCGNATVVIIQCTMLLSPQVKIYFKVSQQKSGFIWFKIKTQHLRFCPAFFF